MLRAFSTKSEKSSLPLFIFLDNAAISGFSKCLRCGRIILLGEPSFFIETGGAEHDKS